MTESQRCIAQVEKRDTWRVGKGGKARMHYNKCRCSRTAKQGDLCRQHANVVAGGGYVIESKL